MDSPTKLEYDNPKEQANILSKCFLLWIYPLLHTSTKKLLTLSDLYKPLKSDRSKCLADSLEKHWNDELIKAQQKGSKPSLLKALIKTFIKSYSTYAILLFITMICLKTPQPLLLSWLVGLFEDGNLYDRNAAYTAATGIVVLSLMSVICFHQVNCGTLTTGMKLRVAVSSLLNRKILKLSRKSLGLTADGQLVNLLSNDCQRFDMVTFYLPYVCLMPFQILLVSYLVWLHIGISGLAGILSMLILTVPLQGFLGRVASKLRLVIASRTDSRVKMMSQIISGIRVIKMYAWEQPFETLIKFLRFKEVQSITKASYLRGYYLSSMVTLDRSSLCLTLICYTLLGNSINAKLVFATAQLLNLLQLVVAIMYPMAIGIGAEALVSISRLETFLLMEEKSDKQIQRVSGGEINLNEVVASWTPERITLKNINLIVPPGSLCAVIGPVGSGKSSMLQLLLGELTLSSGSVSVGKNISFAAQEPWLFASSVRKNILFGNEYDHHRYKEVTKMCALTTDFHQFPHGDKTLVGERGVSLSGGQRARINLARAVYRQADIYLLDDPLSAVDTHVGKHLFQKCIMKYLQGRTRVLVTHQLQYLKKADLILVLNEGEIDAVGTFKDLSKANLDFTKLLACAEESLEEKDRKKSEIESDKLANTISDIENSLEASSQIGEEEGEGSKKSGRSPLWIYFKSVDSFCMLFSLILLLVASQVVLTACDLFVAFWSNQEEIRHQASKLPIQNLFASNSSGNSSPVFGLLFADFVDQIELNHSTHYLLKTDVNMIVYGLLVILGLILCSGRAVFFFTITMRASRNIHSKIFHCLLQAPMRFFDTNPTGRVLNRFSKDVGAIDETLPKVCLETTQVLLIVMGIMVVVTVSNYYMLIAIVLLGCAFMKMRSWFISSAKRVKHLEGISKSPVFTHISATLRGLITIRAFEAEEILTDEFDEHQDVHTAAHYTTVICCEFFGLWLDMICVIFIACICYLFVVSADFGYMTSGSFVGLAISQSLALTGMLQYGMKQTVETINQLTSVERVLQYTELENEGPFETPQGKLPVLPWPSFGKIEFKNLSLYYVQGDEPVLKNLNLIINSGEKVGVVGRTGAGKSSLITALFRLAIIRGQVLIDDLDTKKIGLTDLRRKISIIPQEPVLFSSTLRLNLDPFKEFTDEEIWTALEEVELKDIVPDLSFQVSEGGSNFSLGQRQLLCLARALLRNNKILLLDEATANVDALTDKLIQKTIRRKFNKFTVITIAHRLNTIMDCDKVLVMKSGHAVEFDHPHQLLQLPNGYFTNMVLETGPTMTEQLRHVALKAWNEKQNIQEDDVYITRL